MRKNFTLSVVKNFSSKDIIEIQNKHSYANDDIFIKDKFFYDLRDFQRSMLEDVVISNDNSFRVGLLDNEQYCFCVEYNLHENIEVGIVVKIDYFIFDSVLSFLDDIKKRYRFFIPSILKKCYFLPEEDLVAFYMIN